MLYTKLAIALAVFAAGSFSGWWVNNWRHNSNELEKQRAESIQQEGLARKTHTLVEQKDAQIRAVNDRLADALVRLRNRAPVRLSETPASCAGASPSALSAQDAAMALRLAAEADQLRADYIACRGWVDAVTR